MAEGFNPMPYGVDRERVSAGIATKSGDTGAIDLGYVS
jgi:hypothetical protein